MMYSLWIRHSMFEWHRVGDFHTVDGAEVAENRYSRNYETVILRKGVPPHPGFSRF